MCKYTQSFKIFWNVKKIIETLISYEAMIQYFCWPQKSLGHFPNCPACIELIIFHTYQYKIVRIVFTFSGHFVKLLRI